TRPPFRPTQQQHEFVSTMSGMDLSVTDICRVIGVSRRTLYKYFRPELEAGSARLHALVSSKFVEAIKDGSPWAMQCALRNLPRFKYDRYDRTIPFIPGDEKDDIQITFVYPSAKPQRLM